MNDLVKNPYGQSPGLPAGIKSAGTSDAMKHVAEVQAAMVVARANPRNPVAAMDRILNACTRPSLAESAVYTYARGGANIEGPSIRLAEAVAQSWGNIQYGVRELDSTDGESQVQAYAWDLETNTRREIVFHVKHERHTRDGKKELTDPRDIYETVANQGARRLRACILSVIPGDVIEAAVNQCNVTMKSSADVSEGGIAKLVKAFESIGVSKAQIEVRIQRRIDAILPAQVATLRKIFSSIKDGMSDVSEWFDQSEQPNQAKALREKIEKTKAKDLLVIEEYIDKLDLCEVESEAVKLMESWLDLAKTKEQRQEIANLGQIRISQLHDKAKGQKDDGL